MKTVDDLVRPSIRRLQPYSSARDEGNAGLDIYLDANENPYGRHNRYPDPYQSNLKKAIAKLKNVPVESIFLGNGSDEIIDLLYRVFCQPGEDQVLICPPTYGMYEVIANVQDIALVQVPLTAEFDLDIDKIIRAIASFPKIKMIFICSPNNPTGNTLQGIDKILSVFDGIVIIDEAYIDFSNKPSQINELERHPNLVVLQTLSKAWGLASVRMGMAFASKNIIQWLNKVKHPYNISGPNQTEALNALKNQETIQQQIHLIQQTRKQLADLLASFAFVREVFPSDANFLLIRVDHANELYAFLIEQGIVVRNRHRLIPGCIRITVGSPDENVRLADSLRLYEKKNQLSR